MEAGWSRMNGQPLISNLSTLAANAYRFIDLIIIQTSQVNLNYTDLGTRGWSSQLQNKGLAEYVLQHVENAQSRGLVIGHDHWHNSEHWANLTTQTFIAKGIKVYTLRGLNHTPMWAYRAMMFNLMPMQLLWRVPFSVKFLKAACGVMITGIHTFFWIYHFRSHVFVDIKPAITPRWVQVLNSTR